MSLSIRTNMMSINANRFVGINNKSVEKSVEKLSTGYKINRASDDSSGLAISEKMKSQIIGLSQAKRNSQDAMSLIQTAEGATNEIHSMLNRMTELAVKSANGTIQNTVDREAIQSEVVSLSEEITRIAEATTFNGIQLLNGETTLTDGTTSSEIVMQTGDNVEPYNQVSVKKYDLSSFALDIETITLETREGALEAIGVISKAISTVSTARAEYGSVQNRLEYTANNLSETSLNMTEANSRIRDTDIALEMMNYTKGSILKNSAQAMLGQANQQPNSLLNLLEVHNPLDIGSSDGISEE